MFGLETDIFILLALCLFAACAFEFVNGFHDTANAVATVIYTNALQPNHAVIWSGIWNFLGVLTGGIGVAIGIVNLLPVELLIDQNVYHSIAMALALLLSAIIWNIGTWYFGLPSSSSHALIGSILGVGAAYTLLPESNGNIAINFDKATETLTSLLLAPMIGFSLAIITMFLFRRIVKGTPSGDIILKEPKKNTVPPMGIRALLIATCTGVSFAHGNNDGQKGVGLIMLILIGIVPFKFALDDSLSPKKMQPSVIGIEKFVNSLDTTALSVVDQVKYIKIKKSVSELHTIIQNPTLTKIPDAKKLSVRKDILLIAKNTEALLKSEAVSMSETDKKVTQKAIDGLKAYTDYAPRWVILLISLSLGLGTMVGWKRIVVTVGEKIGKQHLTYAQGASAELVAALTIAFSSFVYKLPVSTTHILSSGIAGTMVANKGVKNLQAKTIKNIAIAWVLTLPVSMLLAGSLFIFLRWVL